MHGSDPILLSQNEWASLGEKAARGAGYDWGHAEEFGWALAELAGMGIDGSTVFCELLALFETDAITVPKRLSDLKPSANKAPLCPVVTGAALCDLGDLALESAALELGDVCYPIFLLPFLDRMSAQMGKRVLAFERDRQLTPQNPDLQTGTIRLGTTQMATAKDRNVAFQRIGIQAQAFEQLKSLGMRTTVPATEQSRAAGAGAGLTDND